MSLQLNHYDHDDAREEVERLTLLDRCRKRAADEETPLRHIFDDVCRSVDAGTSVSFAAVESSMYKRRRTAMPTLPRDPQSCDTALSNSRFAFVGQSPFYRGHVTCGDNDTALIFASEHQLALLCPSSVVYIDSTFRVVPSLFYQLFTIFVPHAEHTFPVCFALMSRKTTALYEAVFGKVRAAVPQFQPPQVIADFEEAPAAAIRAVFGNEVIISGCWFHFTQALVKRVRKLDLVNAFRDDSVQMSSVSSAPAGRRHKARI